MGDDVVQLAGDADRFVLHRALRLLLPLRLGQVGEIDGGGGPAAGSEAPARREGGAYSSQAYTSSGIEPASTAGRSMATTAAAA